jgi:3-hydroxyisobutyrate dehydrogenase
MAIGFVGLGRMGAPMVSRLIGAGYPVSGYDVSDEAGRLVAGLGADIVASVKDLGAGSSALILMLPDSAAVGAVLSDPGLLETLRPGTLLIDMSSSEPLQTRALASQLGERGLRMIDAPVSGGVAGAEKGTLTVMVGAEVKELAEAKPVLEVLGRVVHAGPVGSGHAVKALNNLMSATHLWITSEAIIAGQRFGLDPETMLSIVNASSGRSGSSENKWPNFILPETYNSGFGLRLMLKDMKIAVQLAEQSGVPSVLGAEAVALWSQAAEGLAPSADHTEIARWLRENPNGADDK